MQKIMEYKELAENKNNEYAKIRIYDTYTIKTDEFKKEKDIEEFIVCNIEKFVNDILEDKLIYYEVNKPIEKQNMMCPRGRRIDLFIKGENKIYIIELKNPTSLIDNRMAIGQILDYGREFADSKKELIIITTKFDINTAKTIDYYNLPIRYIFLSKERCLEYEQTD